MPALLRINAPDALADYLDSADEIYGSGADSSATLTGSGNSMSSDMYYYNLTLADNAVLDTAGYRLFVKNVLTIGTGVVIGRAGGATTTGTLKAGAAAEATATNSLGGNGAAGNAVAPTAAQGGAQYYQYAAQAIKGFGTGVFPSHWLEMTKSRLYDGNAAAAWTLHRVVRDLLSALTPICPFFTHYLSTTLYGHSAVDARSFPRLPAGAVGAADRFGVGSLLL